MDEPPQTLDVSPPPAPPPPRRDPFWSYSDLCLMVGLAIPAMLLGVGLIRAVTAALHLHLRAKALEAIPAQFIGYGILFWLVALIFRVQYGRAFWDSVAWRPLAAPPLNIVGCGFVVSLCVAIGGSVLGAPDGPNPMKEMLADPVSLVVLAVFGTTLGPLCEELVFRGILQPLLVRSLGTVAGIVAAAVPFGMLHWQQYGNSWRHVILISAAGAAFGWMRHVTGSTRASTLMHASYNGLLFAAYIAYTRSQAHV